MLQFLVAVVFKFRVLYSMSVIGLVSTLVTRSVGTCAKDVRKFYNDRDVRILYTVLVSIMEDGKSLADPFSSLL